MTLGEKIKEARKQCMLSQEELAEKMSVSRSAIAKWETDKGLPDIDNLKMIAKTLNVSLDYLLDDSDESEQMVVRESYDLSQYGKGSKKKRKDRVVKEKFPNDEVYTLIAKYKAGKKIRILDNLIGFFTDAPFGLPQFTQECKNIDNEYYLVEKESGQLFVTVSDEFIETKRLPKRITEKKFTIGEWTYIKCNYTVK